jgi:AraC family transcriptional regulator, regulatory protein of adaptative response / methylated-DNA-[protein]-cysteine methyltransferase
MAQLDAGYQSGSGFRDAFATIMGAPPGSGAARALFAAWLDTPLGPMMAIGDEDALYLLEYVDRPGLERQIERLRARTKAGIVPGRTGPIARIETELAAYFGGRLTRFETPLTRLGSPFQHAVWDANQLAIIVPCHRVISTDGGLGGYGGGVARKRWLLEHERRLAPAAPARARELEAVGG